MLNENLSKAKAALANHKAYEYCYEQNDQDYGPCLNWFGKQKVVSLCWDEETSKIVLFIVSPNEKSEIIESPSLEAQRKALDWVMQ